MRLARQRVHLALGLAFFGVVFFGALATRAQSAAPAYYEKTTIPIPPWASLENISVDISWVDPVGHTLVIADRTGNAVQVIDTQAYRFLRAAGQIRFVTKSGSRDIHGDLVENFRNSALDANTWTRNHSALAPIASGAAPYRFNQFGYDVGGPVFVPGHFNKDRNKLFFFVAQEWTKRRYENTNTGDHTRQGPDLLHPHTLRHLFNMQVRSFPGDCP